MSSAQFVEVRLAEVAHLDIDRVAVDAADTYSMAGLLIAGRGLFWRGQLMGTETSYQALHRLRAGQLVMRKLTAWEGPITTVPAEYDGGFVSSEFPTFALDESRLVPEYMRLICQRPAFHAEMKKRSRGTAERRKRLDPGGLLAIAIPLPSVDVQRRIVRVLAAADRVIAAYSAEAHAGRSLLREARAQLLDGLDSRPLDAVLTDIEAGKSPKSFDRPPANGERGVLKVSAIRPDEFRPDEAKAVTDDVDFPDHALVCSGDVLISRANTRALVGVTCRVTTAPSRLYLSDKTLRLVIDEEVLDPVYLIHAIASSVSRRYIEANATGTSESMKNISQKTIRSTPIPFIDDVDEQRRVARELATIADAVTSAERLRDAAAKARESLLESLVRGQVLPPALVETVA